jgi:nucleotide-binding universal stress UspA family protein
MPAPPQPAVIVGIDGSRDSFIALGWAARYAAEKHWQIHGVHVVDDTRPAPTPVETTGPDDGTEVLEDAAEELARLGFAGARLEIRHGNAAEVLLDLSRHAALLVIGRRGAGGFAELVVGSTSQVCAALATCALVVVPDSWRPDADPHGRVVVGVDGSVSGQSALGFGFETASRRGAELVPVHVPDVPEAFPRPDLWLNTDEAPWQADAEALVAGALAGWPEKYPGVAVRTQYSLGHPVQVLARASETADLLVVGGVGRSKFTPLRMGSVSRGLLHHSQCPVAVVHEQQE